MMKFSPIAVVVAMVLLCACSDKSSNASSDSTPVQTSQSAVERQVREDVKNIQALLPQKADDNLMITSVSYDPKSKTIDYRYDYTDTNYPEPSEENLNQLKAELSESVKEIPQEMFYLQNGITVVNSFYTPEGAQLFKVEVRPEDILQ